MKDRICNWIIVAAMLFLIGAGVREMLIHNGRLTTDLNADGHSITNLPDGFFPPSGVTSVNGKTGVVEVTASDISCTNSAGAGTVQSVFDAFRNGYNANIPYFLQGHTSSAEEKRWDSLLYGAGHTFDWRVNSNYDVGFNWVLVDDIILKGWSEDGDHSLTNALRRLGNSTSPDSVTWQGLGMFSETGTVHYAIDAEGATTAQRLYSPDGVYYVGDLKRESTNAAVAVVREMSLGGIWDKRLNVWWTPVMENGALTYQATTNVNLNAGGN